MKKPVHMKREAEAGNTMADVNQSKEDYPYGLRIHLDEKDMEKCGLKMPEVGGMVHIMAMTKVVSIHAHESEDHKSAGVDLQITHLACEDEDDEDMSREARTIYGKGTK